jgi:Putative auto-transporter adhesin, head GIN domain
MKQLSVLLLATFTFIFTACEKVNGDGPIVTENRSTSQFNGIDVRIDADVQVAQHPNYKLEINAQQNILDVLDTYVSNNILIIKFRNDVNVRTHRPITIVLSAPMISSMRLSGSGNMEAAGTLTPPDMDLEVSGSGNLRIQQLNTGNIDAFVSGSGNIEVGSGTATDERVDISGSGGIDLSNVSAQKATTFTSGSGNMRVNASQQLKVTISGSGNVFYRGNPTITTTISGSGKVVHF